VSILIVVVFPAPFGPRKPNTSERADVERYAINRDLVAEQPGEFGDADDLITCHNVDL